MTPSRVLVASSDTAIRKLMANCLIQAGYGVIEVGSGNSAIAAVLNDRMGVLLAILDGQLPPVSSNRVVAELRKIGNQLPVILTSGSFIVDELPALDHRIELLAKPFEFNDLIRCVKRLLEKQES